MLGELSRERVGLFDESEPRLEFGRKSVDCNC